MTGEKRERSEREIARERKKQARKEILKRSCTEILSVEPSSVCVNQTFDIVLRGNGFSLGRSNDGVVCSFILDELIITCLQIKVRFRVRAEFESKVDVRMPRNFYAGT
ncbi:hypothetical protein WMY93_020397 [Mugilogobius chulae]|uniref:Anthrax toxin receptor extracellular domain-containing protein n=1 Tax=Mugilogobius chulae TaxID=88201 RepID=A0AAW0NMT7_9GOBI